MVLENISYAVVFGQPVILWLGIATLIILLCVAAVGYLLYKGNRQVKFGWHKYLAIMLVIIAVIHGGLAILHYFF